MKKLVIFDFDGTLVDSVTDVALCFNTALQEHGYPTKDLSDIKKAIGGNLEQVVSRLLPENRCTRLDIESVKSSYRKIYLHSEKPNTRPYPGITGLLEALQKQNILLAINTNKGQALVDALVYQLFPGINFTIIVGYNEQFPSKPDPYGVSTILEKCHLKSSEAIYIGDGKSDIDTAAAANMDFLYVTWGQGTEDDLQVIGQDQRINTCEELLCHIVRFT